MSNDNNQWTKDRVLGFITRVETEAIIAGSIQRIELTTHADGEHPNPAEVPDMLRVLDPGVQFKEKFYTGKGGGNRDTKLAWVLVITAEVKDSGKYISMTAQSKDGEDVTVKVSKKKSDEWLPNIEALGKLTDKNLEKLKHAFEAKKAVTVILTEPEQFGALYFQTDDGTAYMDSLQANAPTEVGGNG